MLEVESVRVIPAVPEQGTSWWLVGGHYRGSRLVAKRLSASDPHNPPDLPDLSHAWGDDWQRNRSKTARRSIRRPTRPSWCVTR